MNPKAVPAVMTDGGCEMITRWVAGAGMTVIGPVVTEESPSAVACKVYPDAAISVVMKAWKLATPPTALTDERPAQRGVARIVLERDRHVAGVPGCEVAVLIQGGNRQAELRA